VEASGDRRIIHLTDAGIAYVEEHRDELGAPWDTVTASVNDGVIELHDLLGQVAAAAMQVAHAGTDKQCAEAKTVLVNARRALYRILADGDDSEGDDGEGDGHS
jgi:hypothetical protein